MSDATDKKFNDIPPEKNRGGEWIAFGDDRYRVPPLSLRSVQELAADVESLATMTRRPTPQQMGVVIKLVHAAIARNYPSMTVEELTEMIDLGNYQDVLSAVLAVSGFKSGGPPGEANAPTGATSTSA